MPRAVTVYRYKFEELDKRTQERALDNLRDINVDHGWWEYEFDDAKGAGLEITGFDDYRAEGRLFKSALDSIAAIHKDHGESCDTYKTASRFKELIVAKMAEYRCTGDQDWEEEDQDLVADYTKELLKDYHRMLMEQERYLQTDEAIKETIECNDYEFDENGDLA